MSIVTLKEDKRRLEIAELPHTVAVLPGLVFPPSFVAIIGTFGFEVKKQPKFVEIINTFGFEVKPQPNFVEVINTFGFEE